MSVFSDYADATAVDEGMSATDHMGAGSVANAQQSNRVMTPTRSLAMLWFFFLGLYWFCGWVFGGQRA